MPGGEAAPVALGIAEAQALVVRVMQALGHDAAEAGLIAAHLIDCELRGLDYGGLARAVSIAERIGRTGKSVRPILVERETPVSARVDGQDQIGYLVAERATAIAIEKAKVTGLAAVAGRDTWYTGMLSYYAERITAAGLVAIIASNATPWVAPHGASEGRFGTNPICIGVPSADEPVIWDIGTSAIIHAQVTLAGRLGKALPEGVAFDAQGEPTVDPASALAGAFAAWGGHRGSGLGIMVQLLGTLAGGPAIPPDLAKFGFLIVALDPGLFGDAAAWRETVSFYAETVRSARPDAGGQPVVMPFDRSRRERERRRTENRISVPESIYRRLVALAGG
jgi:LDH2 family malate/lactate/ureidoglycolate dehydrogenase